MQQRFKLAVVANSLKQQVNEWVWASSNKNLIYAHRQQAQCSYSLLTPRLEDQEYVRGDPLGITVESRGSEISQT